MCAPSFFSPSPHHPVVSFLFAHILDARHARESRFLFPAEQDPPFFFFLFFYFLFRDKQFFRPADLHLVDLPLSFSFSGLRAFRRLQRLLLSGDSFRSPSFFPGEKILLFFSPPLVRKGGRRRTRFFFFFFVRMAFVPSLLFFPARSPRETSPLLEVAPPPLPGKSEAPAAEISNRSRRPSPLGGRPPFFPFLGAYRKCEVLFLFQSFDSSPSRH